MKPVTLVLISSILFTITSCSQDLRKLDESEVDSEKIQFAQTFANEYLSKQKRGSYYEFQDEAIDDLKNRLTEERQKQVYGKLKSNFGDFQSLKYVETWTKSGNSPLNIVRFKSDFEKRNKQLEVRIVLDKSDKIAGIWIKPWSDVLK